MSGVTVGDTALRALSDEAGALQAGLRALSAADWDRPTRCEPWRVRDVVGHLVILLGRVPDMVRTSGTAPADTTATGYYRADDRFSAATNADRVSRAQDRAGAAPDSLVRTLSDTWQAVADACADQPADRVVRTRHGDAMLLGDFLTTRVVELALHGFDVADAVRRPPWLTPSATDHLLELLFGPDWRAAVAGLGWSPETVLRKASGRAPVDADESAALDRRGLRRLALG